MATLPIQNSDANTWTQVVERAESILGRSLDIRYVAPGEPLPGRPPVAGQFGALFEMYESVIGTSDATAMHGVRLTTIDDLLRAMLQPRDA